MNNKVFDKVLFFVAKSIATANKTPDKLADGEIGFFDPDTMKSADASSFGKLPSQVVIMSNWKGNIHSTIEPVSKIAIRNAVSKKYEESVLPEWKLVFDTCSCIKTAKVSVHVSEVTNGFDTNKPVNTFNFTVTAPSELDCYCGCSDKSAYANNVMTMLMFEKINSSKNLFFEAEVYEKGGSKLNTIDDIKSFISTNKDVNTDDDKGNNKKLELHIKGKALNVSDYVFGYDDYLADVPTGAKISVTACVNEDTYITCDKVTEQVFEVGNGFELRAEEFKNIQNYTGDYNAFDKDSVMTVVSELQFEADKKYDTVTFEYLSEKANITHAVTKERGTVIVIASDKDVRSEVFTKMKQLFK